MSEVDTASVTSVTSSGSGRPKKFVCNFEGCERAYSKPSLLEQHKRSHTGERPFICSQDGCNKSFLRKSHLDAHLISHNSDEEKPFRCSICGKGVNTPQHLKRHEIIHTKSFICTVEGCQESFYKHQSLRHHILSIHERKLTCEICNKQFNRPYRLAQHKVKHHSEAPAYQCDHTGCFSSFKTWSALQFHVKTEHPKLTCAICGKGCVGKKGLKSHMLSHDESKMLKLWNCNYCTSRYSKKIELIEHYNLIHDGNIPDDLLTIQDKLKLEELLNETDKNINNSFDDDKNMDLNTLEGLKNKGYQSVSDSEEDDDDEEFEDHRSDSPQSHTSIDTLNSKLMNGTESIIGLISKNFSMRKLQCPKPNCDRAFRRSHDLSRHLKWHEEHLKKVEEFLNSLEKEKQKEKEKEPPLKKIKLTDNEPINDDNLDELIDVELRRLKAGDKS
ncbi:strongly-conserved Zn-finger binding protein [Scheffersomyces amazonensis]|uniref:strongly-conserved Zn-finger binding protein n=1 Tax=Scheffersomyces amazonensis TaxID=1078765 RepID=UPI00315D4378